MIEKVNEMNPEQIIEKVINVIPYPNQIKDIDISNNAVRFTWRDTRFRVSESLMVEEVQGNLLTGSNIAIMLEQLIKGAKWVI